MHAVHRKYRVVVMALVSAMMLTVVVAGSAQAAQGKAASKHLQTLNVALAATDVTYAPVYIGVAKGFYQKAGLNVKIVTSSAAADTPEVVSGQADLALFSLGSALAAANQGVNTRIILSAQTPASSGWVVSSDPSVKSVSQCQKMGSLPLGGGMYANAINYEKQFKANYSIVQAGDLGTVLDQAISKQTDCALTAWQAALPGIASKQLHFILNPNKDPSVANFKTISAGVIWGVQKNLAAKRLEIQAFLRVYNQTLQWMDKNSYVAQARLVDSQVPAFRSESVSSVAAALQATRPVQNPDSGYLPANTWRPTLQFFQRGGLPFLDASKPAFAYAKRVDMSYYDEAIGKPKAAK
jgi:NitT/TauT family transport system substrate-binding protein